ncbi:adenylate cyclase type 10-like [Tubulanus polymorphus]|uniref:adenylate cyclase type 10-like n=1 Tax=Tubulanus polymorphus TaxID=672921 RepID=UPI003DA22C75
MDQSTELPNLPSVGGLNAIRGKSSKEKPAILKELINHNNSSPSTPVVNKYSTHIPDCVVSTNLDEPPPYIKRIKGVLMFADISGFTALCERYTLSASSGTDQLTKTLNGYLGAIVEKILSSDGDVLKYAGDAILAVWPVKNDKQLANTVMQVLRCAIIIQDRYGEWNTDIGVKLKVKLGISAGKICLTYLGNNDFRHYVTTGRAIRDVNLAEKFCESGYVVLSPASWAYCDSNIVSHIVLADGRHVRALGLKKDVRPNYVMLRTVNFETATQQFNIQSSRELELMFLRRNPGRKSLIVGRSQSLEFHLQETVSSSVLASADNIILEDPEVRVRNAVFLRGGSDSDEKMGLYITKPVLNKLRADQPLEYLSEMRQVSIVFMNLVLEPMKKEDQSRILQETFQLIYSQVNPLNGCLNKVFLFDKGLTFLVIFGFPGYKHENESAHALESAMKLLDACTNVIGIELTSIGVTTGLTFCGVVGHPHRQEYTVIGRKVNMAARLMMHYPGKVTCDTDTYHHAKLPKYYYNELVTKEMKGLQNVGTILEFVGPTALDDELEVKKYEYPLLARDQEMKACIDAMNAKHGFQPGEPCPKANVHLVVLEGDSGMGKTRMLEQIMYFALERNWMVVMVTVLMNDSRTPYNVLKTILMDLLGLNYQMDHQKREEVITKLVSDNYPLVKPQLYLLNDILETKFPTIQHDNSHLKDDDRMEALKDLIRHIIAMMTKIYGFVVLLLDDAHNIDSETWSFIHILGGDIHSLVFLTCRPIRGHDNPIAAELHHKNKKTIEVVQLDGLPKRYLPALACQMLGVSRLPAFITKIIESRSHGVPSWCEQLLREMLFEQVIKVIETSRPDKSLVEPEKEFIEKIPINFGCFDVARRSRKGALDSDDAMSFQAQDVVFHRRSDDAAVVKDDQSIEQIDDNKVCILNPESSAHIEGVKVPDSMKALILTRIDQLDITDQMIIKCAAIIGEYISRRMLEYILPDNYLPKLPDTIERLMKTGVLECASPKRRILEEKMVRYAAASRKHKVLQERGLPAMLQDTACYCNPDGKRSDCQIMQFGSTIMQETAYGIFLEAQRTELHIRCAEFLESQAHKCEACGGGDWMPAYYAPFYHQIQTPTKNTVAASKRAQAVSWSGGPLAQARNFQKERRGTMEWKPKRPPRAKRMSIVRGLQANKVKPASSSGVNLLEQQTLPSGGNIFQVRGEESAVSNGYELSGLLNPNQIQAVKLRRLSLKMFLGFISPEELPEDMSSSTSVDMEEVLADIDLRACECDKVLASVYPQLVRHWRSAGNVGRTVHFMSEAGAAAIATFNNLQAKSYVEEAHKIIEAVKAGDNPFVTEVSEVTETQITLEERARLAILTGQAFLNMGQYAEAKENCLKALELMQNSQPNNNAKVLGRIIKEGVKQIIRRIKGREPDIDLIRDFEQKERVVEQVRCLHLLYKTYRLQNQPLNSMMVALQQVNLAELVGDIVREQILAYTALMEACQWLRWTNLSRKYEAIALRRCMNTLDDFTPDDLSAVANLHAVCCINHLVLGELQKACESGYNVERISRKVHDNETRLKALPMLVRSLLLSGKTTDVVEVLEQLKYIAEEANDRLGLANYYCCCLDLLLEAGFQLESFEDCLNFATEAMNDPTLANDPLVKFYLASAICLWYSRTSSSTESTEFWYKMANLYMMDSFERLTTVHGFIKIIECQLLRLSQFIALNSNDATLNQWKTICLHLMEKLRIICQRFTVFQPRMYLLRSYYHMITGFTGIAKAYLLRSINRSKKTGNVLDEEWAEHCKQVWFDPEHDLVQHSFWMMYNDSGMVDHHVAQSIPGSLIKYSLPLPHWFDVSGSKRYNVSKDATNAKSNIDSIKEDDEENEGIDEEDYREVELNTETYA